MALYKVQSDVLGANWIGFPTIELLERGSISAFYSFGEAIPNEVPKLGAEARVAISQIQGRVVIFACCNLGWGGL